MLVKLRKALLHINLGILIDTQSFEVFQGEECKPFTKFPVLLLVTPKDYHAFKS